MSPNHSLIETNDRGVNIMCLESLHNLVERRRRCNVPKVRIL